VLAAASMGAPSLRAALVRRGLGPFSRLLGVEEPSLWTIAHASRIVGVLGRTGESYRLDWFDGADARLVTYDGPVSGDVEALTSALARRLGDGGKVRIAAVPI
jgi:hypothetical protein